MFRFVDRKYYSRGDIKEIILFKMFVFMGKKKRKEGQRS